MPSIQITARAYGETCEYIARLSKETGQSPSAVGRALIDSAVEAIKSGKIDPPSVEAIAARKERTSLSNKTIFSEEIIEKIKSLVESGKVKSTVELEYEMNIPYHALNGLVKQLGLEYKRGADVSESALNASVEMFKQGRTNKSKMCRDLGITMHQLNSILDDLGIDHAQVRKTITREMAIEGKRMIDEGRKLKDAAHRIGVSSPGLKLAIKRYGL